MEKTKKQKGSFSLRRRRSASSAAHTLIPGYRSPIGLKRARLPLVPLIFYILCFVVLSSESYVTTPPHHRRHRPRGQLPQHTVKKYTNDLPTTALYMVDESSSSSSEKSGTGKKKSTAKSPRKKKSTGEKTEQTTRKRKSATKGVKGAATSKTSNKNKATKGARKKASKGPVYSVHPLDKLELRVSNDEADADIPNITGIRFKVRGNPRPLVRHRSARGFVYNPSSGNQKLFQHFVMEFLSTAGKESNLRPAIPIFSSEVPLAMTVVFRMRRPNIHFVGSKREPDRLRETAPDMLSSQKQDVDNLAKFVMDSMNGILYEDDKQVISLHVTKLVDNEMFSDGSIYVCEGSTEVYLRKVTPDKADELIEKSFDVV